MMSHFISHLISHLMSHLVCCLSVSQERLARLSVKLSLPEAQLREAPYRVFPIHPSFRVVCLAAPPEKGRQWLTNEVRGEENIQCIIFTVPGSEHNYTVNLIKCFTASTVTVSLNFIGPISTVAGVATVPLLPPGRWRPRRVSFFLLCAVFFRSPHAPQRTPLWSRGCAKGTWARRARRARRAKWE